MLAAVVTGLVGPRRRGPDLRSEVVRGHQGTSSCGDVGYPMLALILVVMVVVGALLLRLTRVVDPGTTSFLGVASASWSRCSCSSTTSWTVPWSWSSRWSARPRSPWPTG